MIILMLETRRGSEDGFIVRYFEAGRHYDIADSLARYFIQKCWATEPSPEPAL